MRMRRRGAFWALLFLTVNSAAALSGGPDLAGYTFLDSTEPGGPTYNFEDISTSTLSTKIDAFDGLFGPAALSPEPAPLGFSFTYYGTPHTEVYVGSPGYLALNESETPFAGISWGVEDFPGPLPPNGVIAALWDDWFYIEAAAAVYYETRGTAPNRRFIVQFEDVRGAFLDPVFGLGDGVTSFQIKIREGSNYIEFHYPSSAEYFLNTSDLHEIGIEAPAGTTGLRYFYESFSGTVPLAIRFQPGVPPPFTPFVQALTPSPTASETIEFQVLLDRTAAFELNDLSLSNGAITSLTQIQDSPPIYGVSAIPLSTGPVSLFLASQALMDETGNLSEASNEAIVDFTASPEPPPNDNLDNATTISAVLGTARAINVLGTREPGEPFHRGVEGGKSLWWRWVAPESMRVRFDVGDVLVPAMVQAYVNDSYAPVQDTSPVAALGSVAFDAIAGQAYLVVADTVDALPAEVILNWSQIGEQDENVFVDDGANPPGFPDLYEIMGYDLAPFFVGNTAELASHQFTSGIGVSGFLAGFPFSSICPDALLLEFISAEATETLLIGIYDDTGPLTGDPSVSDYSTSGSYTHLLTSPQDEGIGLQMVPDGGVYVFRPSTGETLYSDPALNAGQKTHMIAYGDGIGDRTCGIDENENAICSVDAAFVGVSLESDGARSFTDIVLTTTARQCDSLSLQFTAFAGPDLYGRRIGEPVLLDGDTNNGGVCTGGNLTSWEIVAPDGATQTAQVSCPDYITAFTPTQVGVYQCTFILRYGGGFGGSVESDVMNVYVTNRQPVASIVQVSEVRLLSPVILDGLSSSDPDGQPLFFSWQLTSTPEASNALLVEPFFARPSFIPDVPGLYVVSLVASDGAWPSAPQTIVIEAEDEPSVSAWNGFFAIGLVSILMFLTFILRRKGWTFV